MHKTAGSVAKSAGMVKSAAEGAASTFCSIPETAGGARTSARKEAIVDMGWATMLKIRILTSLNLDS